MSIDIKTFTAEIESDFPQYKASGLIDKTDIYKWVKFAMKKFGQTICTLQDGIAHVKDGRAILADNFHSLHYAVKCSPTGFNYTEEDKPIIQNSLIWKERIERSTEFSSCEPCCKTETEKIIRENVYINDSLITFYYEYPVKLKLGKGFIKDSCAKDCRNLIVSESPYEININGLTLNSNFEEGVIYLQYYGVEVNEEGLVMIPDTPKGELYTYLEYHVKMKLLEKIVSNGDDTNAISLLKYYAENERAKFVMAQSDARYMTLTPNSYKRIMMYNKRNIGKYEMLLPSNF